LGVKLSWCFHINLSALIDNFFWSQDLINNEEDSLVMWSVQCSIKWHQLESKNNFKIKYPIDGAKQ
jgi:hypothetical protein